VEQEQGQAVVLLLKLEVQVVEVHKNMQVMALKDLEDRVILLPQIHLKVMMVEMVILLMVLDVMDNQVEEEVQQPLEQMVEVHLQELEQMVVQGHLIQSQEQTQHTLVVEVEPLLEIIVMLVERVVLVVEVTEHQEMVEL
jgi:hypothetical protein